jgi:hypothetical protein
MKWMEPFLESGQIAGKIACPNKKCGAKLGNYDWAGMCCGCKEWVTPVCLLSSSSVFFIISSCAELSTYSPRRYSGLLHKPVQGRRGGMRVRRASYPSIIIFHWFYLLFISTHTRVFCIGLYFSYVSEHIYLYLYSI